MELYIIPSAHISVDSVNKVKRALKEREIDTVAVELCPQRARALLSGKRPGIVSMLFSPTYAFMFLAQQFIGFVFKSKPGLEMETAIKEGARRKKRILLADMPIGMIMQGFKKIPWREKLKMLLPSKTPIPAKMSLKTITKPENIRPLLDYMKKEFPNTHYFLVERRNQYIFRSLLNFPEDSVLLVIGAGHVPGITDLIKKHNLKNPEKKINAVVL